MSIALAPYSEYKDSDLPGTEKIPIHWKKSPLRGITQTKSNRGRLDLPLLSVYRDYGVILKASRDDNHNKDGADLSTYKVVSEGDLVINKMKTWQGSLGVSDHDGIVSPAYIVCNLTGPVYGRFLHHLLRSRPYIDHYNRLSFGVRVSQWDMRYDDFKQIPVYLPPLDEQKAIAGFVDAQYRHINHLIRDKRRLIELLNEQKQVIIHQVVTRGLDPNVRLKPSGIDWLGDVPEHWEVKRLKYFARIAGRIGYRGYTTNDLVAPGEGALTLGATHINTSGEIDLSSPVFISWRKYYESPEIIVNQGDILVVQRGSTSGKIGFVLKNLGAATINPSLILVSDISEIAEFVFLSLTCATTRSYFNSRLSSTAIPMLSQEQVGNTPVLLPPMKEQQQLLKSLKSEVSTLEFAIVNARREIDLLREYRTILIANVVMGKLDVRGVKLPVIDEAEALEDINFDEDTDAEELIESEEVTCDE